MYETPSFPSQQTHQASQHQMQQQSHQPQYQQPKPATQPPRPIQPIQHQPMKLTGDEDEIEIPAFIRKKMM